jgi:hypothetical protein
MTTPASQLHDHATALRVRAVTETSLTREEKVGLHATSAQSALIALATATGVEALLNSGHIFHFLTGTQLAREINNITAVIRRRPAPWEPWRALWPRSS